MELLQTTPPRNASSSVSPTVKWANNLLKCARLHAIQAMHFGTAVFVFLSAITQCLAM